MGREEMSNYDIKVIIDRLKNGEDFDTLERFYDVSKEFIIEDIRKFYNLNEYEDVRKYLMLSQKKFNKPADSTAITYAKYYKKRGYSYGQFLKFMAESKRPFSERAKLLAKQVFENDENIEKHEKSNDEIEM